MSLRDKRPIAKWHFSVAWCAKMEMHPRFGAPRYSDSGTSRSSSDFGASMPGP
jgi:hypothetical protein